MNTDQESPAPQNQRLPGDREGYSAWVERLEPIAAQCVGWMQHRITELTDRLRAADASLAQARAERDDLSVLLGQHIATLGDWQQACERVGVELDQARADVAALKSALIKYGAHTGMCISGDGPYGYLCECGLFDIVDAKEFMDALATSHQQQLSFTNAEFCRFVQEAKEQRERADKAEAALNDQVATLQAAIDRAEDFPCPQCGYPLAIACAHEADLAQAQADVAALKEVLRLADDVAYCANAVLGDRLNPDWQFPNLAHAVDTYHLHQQPGASPADAPPWIRRGVGELNGRRQRYVTCLDCGWLTYTDSPTVVDHTTDCPHATVPTSDQPQATGDESDD